MLFENYEKWCMKLEMHIQNGLKTLLDGNNAKEIRWVHSVIINIVVNLIKTIKLKH